MSSITNQQQPAWFGAQLLYISTGNGETYALHNTGRLSNTGDIYYDWECLSDRRFGVVTLLPLRAAADVVVVDYLDENFWAYHTNNPDYRECTCTPHAIVNRLNSLTRLNKFKLKHQCSK